ncbi:MAG: hypothetical protein V1678_04950 [Candidatus Aenigmatarchaeota archaeon]
MADWGKTHAVRQRLIKDGTIQIINGVDCYQGRPIIHRDSAVIGGVYLGEVPREAIVVDFDRSPVLMNLYKTAKDRATEGGIIRKDKVLNSVFATVKEALPNQNIEGVKSIVKRYNIENDGKISLEIFIDEKTGVCRHSALSCAGTLEMFKKEGYIKGKPSVDRNYASLPSGLEGGHAWCRYENTIGDKIAIDVTHDFMGTLEDAQKQNKWPYHRPDDY